MDPRSAKVFDPLPGGKGGREMGELNGGYTRNIMFFYNNTWFINKFGDGFQTSHGVLIWYGGIYDQLNNVENMLRICDWTLINFGM